MTFFLKEKNNENLYKIYGYKHSYIWILSLLPVDYDSWRLENLTIKSGEILCFNR